MTRADVIARLWNDNPPPCWLCGKKVQPCDEDRCVQLWRLGSERHRQGPDGGGGVSGGKSA